MKTKVVFGLLALLGLGACQADSGRRAASSTPPILVTVQHPVEKNIPATSGQAQEIWTYSNKVKKQFTFELNTSGVYKLKEIKDLAVK